MTTDNTMRAAALKPCPFCVDGGRPGVYHEPERLRAAVNCTACRAAGPLVGGLTKATREEDAVEAWNRRADAAALAAARAEGYKAGMEKGAEICDEISIEQELWSTEARVAQYCADEIRFRLDKPDAIRAEIGKEG